MEKGYVVKKDGPQLRQVPGHSGRVASIGDGAGSEMWGTLD